MKEHPFANVLLRQTLGTLAIASALVPLNTHAATAGISINVDKPTVPLSPHLYGLFFEDINYGADGGLYAELVQNRSFEYFKWDHGIHGKCDMGPLFAWETVQREGAKVNADVVSTSPLNKNNTKYLELKIGDAGVGGISNSGFFGIPIDAGAKYDVSLFARSAGWSGDSDLTVALEDADGSSCGSIILKGAGTSWRKLEGVLTVKRSADKARLSVTTKGKGTLNLDMVSLFPQDTWSGRKNGLRKDLVQSLKDLNPKFLRFPGGCITHGLGVENMYRWKDSVCPVEERKPNFNLWGYFQTYGLGYYEYFLLCEDLGMEPLPVVPIGLSCAFRDQVAVPKDQLQPYIDDAIDLIEFASGPATSKWGAVRARMGHPEPFKMEHILLGNEEFDNPLTHEYFPTFVEAVRKAHPEIKIVGTSGPNAGISLYDLMVKQKVYSSDEHYYEPPAWFIRNQHRFDKFDRNKPKIFVGEYASGGNAMFNALAEAAYLTGAERNGDIVDMTCYAPLFARNDVGGWRPDLIFFTNRKVMLTPNYHVQQLFGQNKGDVYLSNNVEVKDEWKPGTLSGGIGIGSWNSAIEVEQITVNGKKIDPSNWTASGGKFEMKDGRYVQSDPGAAPAMSMGSEIYSCETVSYAIRARKTSGNEGFLIRFGADEDGKNGFWWNLGGWGNTRHALEQFNGDGHGVVLSEPGSINPGQWYDLKVELGPGVIRCSLDGKLIHEYKTEAAPLSVASTFDKASGEVIIKLVNPSPVPVDASITLAGVKDVAAKARLISLSGDKGAVNTFEKPDTIQPVMSQIHVGREFKHTVPAMAVEFIRAKAR